MREDFSLLEWEGIKNFFRRGLFGDEWARKFVIEDTTETLRRLFRRAGSKGGGK